MLPIETPTDLKDTSVEVVVVVQPLADTTIAASRESEPRYNAWGKPTTKKSISDAISTIQQLRREVALDKASIRSMIEEGRRF
jgi:short-subunit dehydrogenase involved in D-alanine esterification of teichoic acids